MFLNILQEISIVYNNGPPFPGVHSAPSVRVMLL